jgi:preprotein translocase subunit SecG
MLYGIILSLIVLLSFLLILVVLLQPGQREGLSGGLAAGMTGSGGMGARRTADLLSKSTTYLAAAFLTLSVIANFAIDRQQPTRSAIQQSVLPGAAPVQAPAPVAQPAETPTEQDDSTPASEN